MLVEIRQADQHQSALDRKNDQRTDEDRDQIALTGCRTAHEGRSDAFKGVAFAGEGLCQTCTRGKQKTCHHTEDIGKNKHKHPGAVEIDAADLGSCRVIAHQIHRPAQPPEPQKQIAQHIDRQQHHDG